MPWQGDFFFCCLCSLYFIQHCSLFKSSEVGYQNQKGTTCILATLTDVILNIKFYWFFYKGIVPEGKFNNVSTYAYTMC